jgi:hypothetical protein
MGKMNVGRVIAGGLLAGLVINISETILNLFVVAAPMEEALRARNLPPVGGGAIGGFVLLCFVLGLSIVWLYAAIRPRFGSGPRTAAIVAVAVWWLTYVFPTIGDVLIGMIPGGLAVTVAIWGLVELIVASVAGAWLYRE